MSDKLYVIFIVVVILIMLLSLSRGIFVKEEVAIRALETQGYTDIEITDKAWFLIGLRGGEKTDAARFTAETNNPIGKKVKVYVFSGWLFKGATIRTK